MKISRFGEKISGDAGILSLMDDLGNAMAEGNMIMMGGGNPGQIPAIQEVIREQLSELLHDEEALNRLVGVYDPPGGEKEFIAALAELLRREYDWDISPANICLTNGSQTAFFLLFNLFGGRYADGSQKKILLPMAPEYIGYADLGIDDDLFVAVRPRIECVGENLFKYRVDFSNITITDEIGAICVSRPTNPTGNVLTDDEIQGLAALAREHQIPLIVDSAYGVPFPNMIFTEARPIWNQDLVLTMSLSKFGLPAVRTGIVIAAEPVISMLSGMNAVVSLAPGSFGAMLTTPLLRSGEILRLSREVIKPYYQEKMERVMAVINEAFSGCPYKVHIPEGAMFLWFWFPDLPITSRELYERLKGRKVLVVAGDYFFPGLEPGWRHIDECIRVNYSQDEAEVHQGIRLIAEEIRTIYAEQG
ncbi:valine--pyruvate transaminase [Desulfogranum mediterraneum]|uniref:valine--pyruvate transaminase n=1 Tax=Desulfogranum mediterraneum TaxID=160661 RepID=UPI000422BE03|nr:valine--pyruvate transaminase [Desulfogranum mediterraneum]